MGNQRTERLVPLLAIFLLYTIFTAFYQTSGRQKPVKATPTPETAPTSDLSTEIGRIIGENCGTSPRYGLHVFSLSQQKVVYTHNGDSLFTPASNMKVYSTALALSQLGPDYRWRTSLFTTASIRDGLIDGDLTLYGRGAPDLSSRGAENHLQYMAEELYRLGVRRVRGNVIGDESYFRGEQLGQGWLWDDLQWYYGARVSALTINSNEISLSVVPSKVIGEAATVTANDEGYTTLVNDTITAPAGERSELGITRPLSDNEIRVWGKFSVSQRGYGARVAVPRPALWAAHLLHKALLRKGIQVDGKPGFRDFRSREKFDPSKATELSFVESRPLAEIVHVTNKESLNLEAELLLKSVGRVKGQPEETEEGEQSVTDNRDDTKMGLDILRRWLSSPALDTQRLALHDASGLSRLNLTTPQATVAVLRKMSTDQVFRNSLPVAGIDGTLQGRLGDAKGRVSAKTGLLTYVSALSGYVTTEAGEELAFAIFCNDETSKRSCKREIDAITNLLTTYR
jgi:serine-type D-Ala-D-Ala carboxypeptidase/endopeptidase (penicillin-binding protein 4)